MLQHGFSHMLCKKKWSGLPGWLCYVAVEGKLVSGNAEMLLKKKITGWPNF